MITSGSLSAVALYNSLDSILPKREEIYAKNKLLQRDVDYFKENVGKVQEPEDLVEDYRLLQITLTAYGLEDEIQKVGFIKKILTSDPTATDSLVNVVADDRWRVLAADLLLSSGVAVLKSDTFETKLVDRLIEVGVEKELDLQAPGIRQAIHFKRAVEEGGIQNPFNLLANPILRDVAMSARNLPEAVLRADIDAQARTLEKVYDFDRFDDARYVDRIIRQYLVNADTENSQSAQTFTLLSGAASGTGFNLII